MRRVLGIVLLTLASTLLVMVLLWRFLAVDYLEERYPAALYCARIRAVDDRTSKPVDFRVEWDYELITPFFKGSGPSAVVTSEDKSVTVALVGLSRRSGLPIMIVAPGYSRATIKILPDPPFRGGEVFELRLKASKSAHPRKE